MSAPFNPAQLATWAEASHYRTMINNSAAFRGAGLSIPQDNSGIYLPSWTSGPHGDPEPQIGKSMFWHYRFVRNGLEVFRGMNCGLVREKFDSFPTSPQYVFGTLLAEVEAGAH